MPKVKGTISDLGLRNAKKTFKNPENEFKFKNAETQTKRNAKVLWCFFTPMVTVPLQNTLNI